jgi:hypothetical protein
MRPLRREWARTSSERKHLRNGLKHTRRANDNFQPNARLNGQPLGVADNRTRANDHTGHLRMLTHNLSQLDSVFVIFATHVFLPLALLWVVNRGDYENALRIQNALSKPT